MKVSKSTLYGVGILILIFSVGHFMTQGGSYSNLNGNVVSATGGDFQEVVVGMKDYNYHPNTIKVKVGVPVRMRLDESVYGCFRDLSIKEWGIRKYLASPSDYVEFIPEKLGKYTFACSMGMGYGTLEVVK